MITQEDERDHDSLSRRQSFNDHIIRRSSSIVERMHTDSELESDTSSINEGMTGSSLTTAASLNANNVLFGGGNLVTTTSSNLANSSSGLPREQLEKRIESLVQENRVLKMEIETFKLRVKSLQEENKELRKASVNIQARAEQEEEYISNKLLKKIQLLKKEKEALANNYEREEEYLTNDLSRKLNQLRNEKVQLEQTLEQEQEQMVNKLMRKIDKLEAETSAKQSNLEQLRREKIELENTLEQEQESLVNRLWKRMERLEAEKRLLQDKLETNSLNTSTNSLGGGGGNGGSGNINSAASSAITHSSNSALSNLASSSNPVSSASSNQMLAASAQMTNSASALLSLGLPPGADQATNLTDHIINLRREVSRLKANLEKAERDHRENISKIVREEKLIKDENVRLQRRLQMEVDRREALCRHLSESESSLEMDDERHFNESTRVRTISSPVPSNHPQSTNTTTTTTTATATSQHKPTDHVERCPTCNQIKPSPLHLINPSSPPSLAHNVAQHTTSAPMNIVNQAGGGIGGPNAQNVCVNRQSSCNNMLNASSSLSSSSSSINSSNQMMMNRGGGGMTSQTSNSQLDSMMLKK